MSNVVQLSSKLPADEDFNGVDAIVEDLLADEDSLRVAVVTYEVAKVTRNVDTKTQIPTIRVRRFEPICDVLNVPAPLQQIIDQAVESRTGRKPLPLDHVEAVLPDDGLGE